MFVIWLMIEGQDSVRIPQNALEGRDGVGAEPLRSSTRYIWLALPVV